MTLDAPYMDDGDVVLHLGDCVEVMAAMEPESVDAICTDPPYGLEFMGKEWDRLWDERGGVTAFKMGDLGPLRNKPTYVGGKTAQEWHQTWVTEALRVLRPGGHLLAFGGTRTFHRLTCAIEDAGFEIRDDLLDLHAPPVEAFMASLDDGQRDAFLRLVSGSPLRAWLYGQGFPKSLDVSKAIDKAAGAEREVVGVSPRHAGRAFDEAKGWNANGLADDAIPITAPATPEAAAWQGWGTALKPAWEPVIVARKPLSGTVAANVLGHGTGALNVDGCLVGTEPVVLKNYKARGREGVTAYGGSHAGETYDVRSGAGRWPANVVLDEEAAGALGAPARYFYTAKCSTAERDGATHPTVKPLALMRWLVRLVTPPGGLVLDPFAGSGTTGLACRAEGFRCVLIEREPEYAQMAAHRLRQLSLFGGAA